MRDPRGGPRWARGGSEADEVVAGGGATRGRPQGDSGWGSGRWMIHRLRLCVCGR